MNLKIFASLLAFICFSMSAFAQWDEGVAAFNQLKYAEAADYFQQTVDKNPESSEGHYMLGLSLFKLERNQEAMHSLRKAYDLNPNDLSVMVAFGEALIANNKKSEGLNHLRKAYDLNPNDLAVKLALSNAYVGSSMYSEAIPILKELSKSQSNTSLLNTQILLAYSYANLKNCEEAKGVLSEIKDEVNLLDKNDPLKMKVMEVYRHCRDAK